MKNKYQSSRRAVLKSSVLGIMAVAIPNILYAQRVIAIESHEDYMDEIFHRYPSIDDEIVSEVVGVSHFNLERLKELVNNRPELSRATWDWGFGDWESAIGAASHVGRKDIVEFLLSKGARPNIFTFGMLGNYEAVKAIITGTPSVLEITGPHGISLLQHVKTGLRTKGVSEKGKSAYRKLIGYLQELGNGDIVNPHMEMTLEEQQKYLGDYMYGNSPEDGLSIKLNMRKNLSLGKIGKFGGALYQKSRNVFTYNGTSSVEIIFTIVEETVVSLTIFEPNLTLKALKVSS